MLNYEGLTQEQVQDFVDNVTIDAELDAMITISPGSDGIVHESEIENASYTYWLSGTVLGIELDDNYAMDPHDLIAKALEVYKQHDGDMGKAAAELNEILNSRL